MCVCVEAGRVRPPSFSSLLLLLPNPNHPPIYLPTYLPIHVLNQGLPPLHAPAPGGDARLRGRGHDAHRGAYLCLPIAMMATVDCVSECVYVWMCGWLGCAFDAHRGACSEVVRWL